MLAVKFTKYLGKNVIQQPGNIDDENLHVAFTQRYLETLRGEAPKLGDQLMRILLTSNENASGDYDVEKVEVKETMPYSLDQSCPCHPPVKETGMPKSPGADEQPCAGVVYSRSCFEDQGTSCIVTGQGFFQEDFSLRNKELASSLLAQAPSSDHMTPTLAFPSQHEEQSGEKMDYPKYPPLLQAVKDGTEEPDIGGHSPQHGQSKAKYPPILQAVRNETGDPDSSQPNGEQSFQVGQSKAKYPPIFEAVRNEPEDPDSTDSNHPNGEQSFEAGQSKAKYPPIFEAVRNEPEDPDITDSNHPNGERSFEAGQSKAKYPPIFEAVRNEPEDPDITDSNHPNGEQSFEAGQSKAKYPPIFEAVRNEPEDPDSTDSNHPNGEQSFEAGQSKAKYPPIFEAVRNEPEDPDITDSNHPNGEQSFEAGQSKAKYPPMFEAVRNEPEDPDSSQPNGDQSAEVGQSKEKYPPISRAVRNETEKPDTGHPCREHSRLQSFFRNGTNPPYSPLSPASGNGQTPPRSAVTEGREPYPPLVQAVNDQQVTRATGQRPQLTTTPMGGTGTYRVDEDLDLF